MRIIFDKCMSHFRFLFEKRKKKDKLCIILASLHNYEIFGVAMWHETFMKQRFLMHLEKFKWYEYFYKGMKYQNF